MHMTAHVVRRCFHYARIDRLLRAEGEMICERLSCDCMSVTTPLFAKTNCFDCEYHNIENDNNILLRLLTRFREITSDRTESSPAHIQSISHLANSLRRHHSAPLNVELLSTFFFAQHRSIALEFVRYRRNLLARSLNAMLIVVQGCNTLHHKVCS